MDNFLFGYVLENDIGSPINAIGIYRKFHNNVVCTCLENNNRIVKNFSLSVRAINDIKDFIIPEIMALGKIETPVAFDKVINQFTFVNEEDVEKNIACTNLWVWERDGFYKAPNVNILYDCFCGIKNICIENGIDERFFNLK